MPLFTVALVIAITFLVMLQVILIAVKPAYQQLALRCVYGVSVIAIIVLAAYWPVHTPTTTPGVPKAHASKPVAV
jgi:hypothetical protein